MSEDTGECADDGKHAWAVLGRDGGTRRMRVRGGRGENPVGGASDPVAAARRAEAARSGPRRLTQTGSPDAGVGSSRRRPLPTQAPSGCHQRSKE